MIHTSMTVGEGVVIVIVVIASSVGLDAVVDAIEVPDCLFSMAVVFRAGMLL